MVAAPARGVIGPQVLPAHITRAAAIGARSTLAEARRSFEARYVRAAMARAGGRTLVAARELGVSRQGLTKLLIRLDLDDSYSSSYADYADVKRQRDDCALE